MFQKLNISAGTFRVPHNFDENEILEFCLYTDKLIYKLQSLFVNQNTSTIHSMGLMMSYSFRQAPKPHMNPVPHLQGKTVKMEAAGSFETLAPN